MHCTTLGTDPSQAFDQYLTNYYKTAVLRYEMNSFFEYLAFSVCMCRGDVDSFSSPKTLAMVLFSDTDFLLRIRSFDDLIMY